MCTATKSTRENRTITGDFRDEVTYFHLIADGKTFVECVLAIVLAIGFQLAHKATCRGGRLPHTPLPLCPCPAGWAHHLARPVHYVSRSVHGPAALRYR